MLLDQAREFMKRIQEDNMTNLVVWINRERGTRWDVRTERQSSSTSIWSYKRIKEKGGGEGNNLHRGGSQVNSEKMPLLMWHKAPIEQKNGFLNPSLTFNKAPHQIYIKIILK